MENILIAKSEKGVWYNKDLKVLSFHDVKGFIKTTFKSRIDMYRFVLGLIDLGYRMMW